MLRLAICLLLLFQQAPPILKTEVGMPAPFRVQREDGTLKKLKAPDAHYSVALVYSSYDNAREGYFCAGSLIRPEWVLTAAHCLSAHTKPSNLKIAAGSAKLSESKLVTTVKIIRHERFDRNSMINDIALIKLADPIHDMQPVKLTDFETERQVFKTDSRATVSGWGSKAFLPKTISEDLLYVRVSVISRRSCNRSYKSAVTENMICAGNKNADACSGDSGGGLVITYQDHMYLEGIVSWGEGCGDPKKPGVYTRVPSYREWIRAHMN
ncbi:MAG TPA: serine protease [Candidatus Angelobacter sp.]